MSRNPQLDTAAATPEQRAVMEEIVGGPHGQIEGPYHAWMQIPELARRCRNLSEFIRFKTPLPKRLQELAILLTGQFWQADFEYYYHANLARKAGLAEETIQAIAAGREPTTLQPDEAVVYRLARELFDTRRVSDATYAEAQQSLGMEQVVVLVATLGYYCLVSMTLNTFQVPLPPGEPSPFPA